MESKKYASKSSWGNGFCDRGKILFDQEEITDFNDDELTDYRAANIGIVFQFYNLIPTLTAYENVALMKEISDSTLDPEAVFGIGRS